MITLERKQNKEQTQLVTQVKDPFPHQEGFLNIETKSKWYPLWI